MGRDHAHASAGSTGGTAARRRRVAYAAGLVGGFFVVELVVGLAARSLALLSDAAHMLTDVVGLGMTLAAMHAAARGSQDPRRTFGLYRLEILAALANTVLLFGVAVWIVVEAVRRFSEPSEVAGLPVLVAAVLGLAVNLVALRLLRGGAADNLNLEGATLEVLADTLGSVAVIVSAVLLQLTGFGWIDPLFGVGIGLFVLPRTWRLGGKALRILLQAAPPDVDLPALKSQLEGLDGVADVHDLHVWTLTSGMEVASAHLRLDRGADPHAVLDRAQQVLGSAHGIEHATLQVEPSEHARCDDCERMTW